MLINIPVKFHEPMLNTFLSYMLPKLKKLQIVCKSRTITLQILKYPNAQLHILSNIPVRFHYYRSNTQIFTKSRAITLKILNKSTPKYLGAQLHMLINIPVKCHDSSSNTF
jgi:hypothetical protein